MTKSELYIVIAKKFDHTPQNIGNGARYDESLYFSLMGSRMRAFVYNWCP